MPATASTGPMVVTAMAVRGSVIAAGRSRSLRLRLQIQEGARALAQPYSFYVTQAVSLLRRCLRRRHGAAVRL
jgi:hypothetical protein